MADEEIQEVRSIRHAISAECGHDVRKLAAYLQSLETEMRLSGELPFGTRSPRPSRPKKNATSSKGQPRLRRKHLA